MTKKILFAVLLIFCSFGVASAEIWAVKTDATNNTNSIININPFTGVVTSSFNAPNYASGNTNMGLAGWKNALYYTNADSNNGTVYIINPTNGNVSSSFTVSGGWGMDGLGYFSNASGSWIYTSGCSVDDVHRYQAANGSSPQFYWSDVSNPLSMAGDNGGAIYTVGNVGGKFGIWEMDPLADNNATWFGNSPSENIVGMAYDGKYLYLSDTDGKLFTMNNSGQLVNTLNVGYNLYALGSTEGSGNKVPLPPAAWLLISGLTGLVGMRRRINNILNM